MSAKKVHYFEPKVDEILEAGLSGKILMSTFPTLWSVVISENVVTVNRLSDRNIVNANWSHEGEIIASEVQNDLSKIAHSILLLDKNGQELKSLTRNVVNGYEAVPCWWPDSKSVVVKTDKGTCNATLDSKNWPVLYNESTACHCVSKTGRIARTVHKNDRYYLEIGGKGGKGPFKLIDGTTDVRGNISWSPSGNHVAFANLINYERGAICIYSFLGDNVQYITSHDGYPYYVCFSPDERFILYTWNDLKGNSSVRAIEIQSGRIITIFDQAKVVIGCHAWKM